MGDCLCMITTSLYWDLEGDMHCHKIGPHSVRVHELARLIDRVCVCSGFSCTLGIKNNFIATLSQEVTSSVHSVRSLSGPAMPHSAKAKRARAMVKDTSSSKNKANKSWEKPASD